MKVFLVLAFVFAVIVVGLIFMPGIQQAETQALSRIGSGQVRIIPGEYIVTLKPQVVNGGQTPFDSKVDKEERVKEKVDKKVLEVNERLQQQGGSVHRVYDLAIQGFAVKGVDNPFPLLTDPDVKNIEPNVMVPYDTQYIPTNFDRIDVDKAATTNYRADGKETKLNVDVAVIDSMVHPHPDLNIHKSVRFITTGNDVWLQTHGTHVAGTCCARDNLAGIVGVAQGARIWSLHACGGTAQDGCPIDAQIAAANYVIQNAAEIEVVTMSIGGGNPESDAKETAFTNMINSGVAHTRSAGNTGTECQVNWGCDHPTAIVVSNLADLDGLCGGRATAIGTTQDDRIAPSSTWGSQIDIRAPGTRLLSTIPTPIEGQASAPNVPPVTNPFIGNSPHGSYALMSGTSMATPTAAGVAALIMLNNPSFTHAQVKTNMQTNAYAQNLACDGSSKGGVVSGSGTRGPEKMLNAAPY